MAITVTLLSAGTSAGSSAVTAGATSTNGARFAVCVAWDAGQTISSVTDSKSNSYSAVGTAQADGNGGLLQWYYSAGGSAGASHTATVTCSGSAFLSISHYQITDGASTSHSGSAQGQDSGGQPFVQTTGTMPSGNWAALAGCSNNTGSDGAYSANASTPTFTLLHSEGTVSTLWTHGVSSTTSSGATAVTPSFNRSGTGGGTSALAILVVEESVGGGGAPTITAQPVGNAAAVGGTAAYAVTSPDATSYQWQTSADGGETWADVSGGTGATTASYTTAAAIAADNGAQYRCVLTNAGGSTNSLGAWFHVSGLGLDGDGRGTSREPQHTAGLADFRNTPVLGVPDFRQPLGAADTRHNHFAQAFRALYFGAAAAPPPPPAPPEPESWVWSTRNRPGSGPLSTGALYIAQPRIWAPAASSPTPQSAALSLGLAVQLAQAAAASIGAAVQAPQSASSVISAAVQQALSAQAGIDAAIQLARTASGSIDAAVQSARAATANADVAVLASRTASASADLAVQSGATAAASIDAYVQASTQIAASLDLLVQQGNAVAAALQLAVQAGITVGSSVDVAVQLARSAAGSIDAAVQQARTAGASADMAIQLARSAGASIDIYVQAGFVAAASISAAVQAAATAVASIGMAVATASSASLSLGAAVSVASTLAVAMQAAVRAAASSACAVDIYITDPTAEIFSAPPLAPRVQAGGRFESVGASRPAALQTTTRSSRQRSRR